MVLSLYNRSLLTNLDTTDMLEILLNAVRDVESGLSNPNLD